MLWKKSLDQIPFDDSALPRWGPTSQEILECQIANVTPSWARDADEADDEEEEEEEEDDEDDVILLALDAMAGAGRQRLDHEVTDHEFFAY